MWLSKLMWLLWLPQHMVVVLMSTIPLSGFAAVCRHPAAPVVAVGMSMLLLCVHFEPPTHQHYYFSNAHRYMQEPELVRVLEHAAAMGLNAAMGLEPAM